MPQADIQPLEPAEATLAAADFGGVAARSSLLERLVERMHSRRGLWLVAALAAALALPSLAIGFKTDDRLIAQSVADGGGGWRMFQITPQRVESFRQTGQLSWWTNPQLSIDFFRPLSAASHWLEYRVYPNAAWLMHLTNVLLYVALVVIAVGLYRTILPAQPRLAALAGLLFAIDDGHAPSVGWISGRNTLLASVFALLAFWFHARGRSGERRLPRAAASALCVGLALSSAEAGSAVFALLFAYAIVFERGGLGARIVSLLPALGVGSIWALLYVAGDHGASGAGLYRELSTPFATLGKGLLDLPKWALSLFGPSVVGTMLLVHPTPARLACLALVLPLLAAGWLALPRTRENAFFALAALLCLPPLFTTEPQDRLLITGSFGAFGLVASFIATAKTSASRFVRGTRTVVLALHVVVSPLMFLATLDHTGPIDYGARAIADAIPPEPPSQVVFLNLPMELTPIYGWQILIDERRQRPRSIPQLYGGASALTVKRTDARTLELSAEDGWGHIPTERVFANLASLPRAGSELEAASIRIAVLESTEDGRPQRVQFRFPDPLESRERLWLMWRGTRPEPWRPPPVGSEVALAALNPFTALQPM